MILVPERRADAQRSDDRRDSPRVPLRMWVRDEAEGGLFQVHEGDIGLGGAFWTSRYPPLGHQLQVGFRLDGVENELLATARLVRTTSNGEDLGIHVCFTEIALRDELALAHFVEKKARELGFPP